MKRLLIALFVLLVAAPANAGEIQGTAGYTIRKSTWRGDWAAGAQLGLGYRFARVFGIDAIGWEELATVDNRFNTGLTIGINGTLPLEKYRPTVRAYFIHQHEEGWVSVKDAPFTAVAGIGRGIRHRAGFGTRLGLEIPIGKKGKHVEWIFNTGIDATFFPDKALGPSMYIGAMAGLGFNYGLEDLP